MANLQLVEVEVAKGRTVYDGSLKRPVGAGSKMKLEKSEAVWLRSHGFLVDPGAEVIPIGDGPNFGTTEGPSVKGVA